MSIIAKPYTFSPNTTAASSQVNSNFDTLYNDYNGGISAANLATDAVTTAKIADSNVTTAKLADGSVTAQKLDFTTPIVLGSTSNSGQSSISLSGLAAKKKLQIRTSFSPSTSMNISVRFNNDSGGNYNWRQETNGAADTSDASATGIIIAPGTSFANRSYVLDVFPNEASRPKSLVGLGVAIGTTNGTAPAKQVVTGSWFNTSDAITRVDIVASTGNLGDATLEVLGWD